MATCCMRNCYGTTSKDLIRSAKDQTPAKALAFLLDLSKCTNNQSQRNGLANFNAFSIFSAKAVIDKIMSMDRNGERYDSSTTGKLIDSLMRDSSSNFDSMLCSGYGQELNDLDSRYNGGNSNGGLLFPPTTTTAQKDKISELLSQNNNYLDNTIGAGLGAGLITINDGSLNSGSNKDAIYDDLFGNTGNPVTSIPDDELINLSLDKRKFTCFVPEFILENYLFIDNSSRALVTSDRIAKLRRLHYEILLPLYNFYYGPTTTPTCQMKIIYGLGSIKNTREVAGGAAFSRHLRGEAVDFLMTGVEFDKVVKDLKSGALRLNFGALANTNGMHITLPYVYENLDVRGMIMSSPKNSSDSLDIEFIF